MTKTIEIDGSIGEGGGQILRTSLALSLITGKPVHLRKIRARRSKPGLQAQHLMCVEAAAKLGKAKLRGASLGSVDLVFEPGPISVRDFFHFRIGTAGATSLVLHTVYLPLALAGGGTVTIEGGTHVKASPCFHFLSRTWTPYMKLLGIDIDLELQGVGFYPRGGGTIRARIGPAAVIRPFRGMTSASVTGATILCASAGLPSHVGDRLTQTTVARLHEIGLDTKVERESWQAASPGCMLGIELPTEPAPTFLFSLGEKGKPAEAVAHEAADHVAGFLRATPLGVDEHSADQLLLPLALADGPSQFRASAISSHLLTNADVIQMFLDRRISCVDGIVSIA